MSYPRKPRLAILTSFGMASVEKWGPLVRLVGRQIVLGWLARRWVRWNGEPEAPIGVGNPQSRGVPTWMIVPPPLCGAVLDLVEQHRRGNGNAQALPPRQRLFDLIAFVRAASDDELERMIDQMALKPSNPQSPRLA